MGSDGDSAIKVFYLNNELFKSKKSKKKNLKMIIIKTNN